MRLWISLLLSLFALTASASPGQPYFVRQLSNLPINLCDSRIGDGTPTNIVGYPAYTWWIAQCGLSTNGADNEQYLAELSMNGPNGTNNSVKAQWLVTKTNMLNGYDAILGPASGSVRFTYCNTYTNSGAAEVVMVTMITNSTDFQNIFCMAKSGASDTTSRSAWVYNGTLALSAPTLVSCMSVTPIINKWSVLNFIFNGANSTIYTNNVAGATVSPGANAGKGLFLFCSSQGGTSPYSGHTAEIITYRTNLSTAARTTLFNYLTNKYKITP